jgi:hypothetical protein
MNCIESYQYIFNIVQDRAVVEIDADADVCPFLQPGPRPLQSEKDLQKRYKNSKKLVKNTGYDESSLLSLSQMILKYK